MKTRNTPTFYGLVPLQEADIDFFLTTPKAEQGGAFSYEFSRQIYARAIDGKFTGTMDWPVIEGGRKGIDLEELKRYWSLNFLTPWAKLPSTTRKRWVATYRERDQSQFLRWAFVTAGEAVKDPAPDMRGSLAVLKIDWDLSDAVLVSWFKRSLKTGRPKTVLREAADGRRAVKGSEPMRPRAPFSQRRESLTTCLRAIAAQRVFDLRGPHEPERFLAEYTEGKLPNTDQFLITQHRINDSKDFYRTMEKDQGIRDLGWCTASDESYPHPSGPREHQGFIVVHAT